jgi:hypothetical protein
MTQPPPLLPFEGTWPEYVERVYQAFLDSFVHAQVHFRGLPVKAQYRPPTDGKGFSFWHVISEAPHPNNRDEQNRIPDLPGRATRVLSAEDRLCRDQAASTKEF